ncbi:hypothetical protein [Streptomyces sp. NPDC002328]|uniref:hypothetical protein n=1 Tax=Streptomyces sp. NPDC002328 TaxID=3364642 RepID=UPI0036C8DB5C
MTRQRLWFFKPGRDAHSSRSLFGNFDPEEAVVEWECLLAGGSFEELIERSELKGCRAEDGEVIDAEIAFVILGDLAALVMGARCQGQGVYCWVA